MKILITGGSGFLGRHLAQKLRDKHEIKIFDRTKTTTDLNFIQGCITSLQDVLEATANTEAIIHLAGVTPGTIADFQAADYPTGYMKANVMGTYNVLESAVRNKVRKVIFASSICAAGTKPVYAPIDEKHPVCPGGHGSREMYGLTKYVGENLCQGYTNMFGLSTICLRFTWIVDLQSEPNLCVEADSGISLLLWTYVDIRDAVQSIEQALRAEEVSHEVFYIAADDTLCRQKNSVIVQKYFSYLAKADIDRRFLDSYRSFFNIGKARKILGYSPEHSWRKV